MSMSSNILEEHTASLLKMEAACSSETLVPTKKSTGFKTQQTPIDKTVYVTLRLISGVAN
jgi:hypothetical protein